MAREEEKQCMRPESVSVVRKKTSECMRILLLLSHSINVVVVEVVVVEVVVVEVVVV